MEGGWVYGKGRYGESIKGVRKDKEYHCNGWKRWRSIRIRDRKDSARIGIIGTEEDGEMMSIRNGEDRERIRIRKRNDEKVQLKEK